MALEEGKWQTLGVLSTPLAAGNLNEINIYLNGFLLRTFNLEAPYFRMQPGRLTVGAEGGGFRGWVDDLKVLGRRLAEEVICNHARGTIIGVEPGDPLESVADDYPVESHEAISDLLPMERRYDNHACERPIPAPVDIHDQADHGHYSCLGQTRRLDSVSAAEKCLRPALLFPTGPLFVDQERPSAIANTFCQSCHVDNHPSVTMQRSTTLSPGTPGELMPLDLRRQPLQNSPKLFGNVPEGHFGAEPITTFQTLPEGTPLDQFTTPSAPID